VHTAPVNGRSHPEFEIEVDFRKFEALMAVRRRVRVDEELSMKDAYDRFIMERVREAP
jgi:hypothetical protein